MLPLRDLSGAFLRRLSGRILGIDSGKTFLGLAISDPQRLVATPLAHMETRIFRLFGEPIKAFLQEHDITTIVIGYPLTMLGKEGKQARWVKHLAYQTYHALDMPVFLKDERRTTATVLAAAGRPLSKKQQDICAATLILQNFLECLPRDIS